MNSLSKKTITVVNITLTLLSLSTFNAIADSATPATDAAIAAARAAETEARTRLAQAEAHLATARASAGRAAEALRSESEGPRRAAAQALQDLENAHIRAAELAVSAAATAGNDARTLVMVMASGGQYLALQGAANAAKMVAETSFRAALSAASLTERAGVAFGQAHYEFFDRNNLIPASRTTIAITPQQLDRCIIACGIAQADPLEACRPLVNATQNDLAAAGRAKVYQNRRSSTEVCGSSPTEGQQKEMGLRSSTQVHCAESQYQSRINAVIQGIQGACAQHYAALARPQGTNSAVAGNAITPIAPPTPVATGAATAPASGTSATVINHSTSAAPVTNCAGPRTESGSVCCSYKFNSEIEGLYTSAENSDNVWNHVRLGFITNDTCETAKNWRKDFYSGSPSCASTSEFQHGATDSIRISVYRARMLACACAAKNNGGGTAAIGAITSKAASQYGGRLPDSCARYDMSTVGRRSDESNPERLTRSRRSSGNASATH